MFEVVVEGYEVADGYDAESMKKERSMKREGGERKNWADGFPYIFAVDAPDQDS